MKATFHIHYRTVWGEELKVVLPDKNVNLCTTDGYLWAGEAELPDSREPIPYYYAVFVAGKCTRREWHVLPHCMVSKGEGTCRLFDDWRDIPREAYFFTSAFVREQGRLTSCPDADSSNRTLVFRATCPMLPSPEHQIRMVGSSDALGGWNPQQALLMYQVMPHQWVGPVPADALSVPFEYKFIAVGPDGSVCWETGSNRQWQYLPVPGECLAVPEAELHFGLPGLRLAGTAIPLFSLRSERSFGVGDFGDLKRFIDWAVLTRQKAVQILPINDSTATHYWTDSYPYKSISIYALHPMYMDLDRLGALADADKQQAFERLRVELNALPDMDYERVNHAKWEYIRLKYEEEGEAVLGSEDFRTFFDRNAEWLRPYAAFSYLRDKFATPDFSAWGEYAAYDPAAIRKLCDADSPAYKDIALFYYVQFRLHRQLLDVGNYARERGVILKGDIPIGVSRYSVETWTEPHYFHLDGQAGAPPDPFSANGQNWGFPTYDWERMAQDGYRWWQRRFAKMAEYFTAYRIDHILGFFRIWEIPSHAVHGLLGQFAPALPLSPQEIESFGLPFREDLYTHPYIDDELLTRTFGNDAIIVKEHFVRPIAGGRYEMRPEFATQRQVEAYFAYKDEPHDIRLRDGLYALISNVLFLRDHRRPNRFHPRIMAQDDYFYTRLGRREKDAFARLHHHFYYERHNDFWRREAMKKLPMLTQCTPMLACGEDLGMIPACVPGVMGELRILSLEIERMPKDPGYEFAPVERYPYTSVCTLSTHDMSTLRGWWRETPALTHDYWHDVLKRPGDAPADAPADVCREVLERQLASPSMLCILSWQDWLSVDERLRCPDIGRERINVPANPHNYWHYRMHLTLEELMRADELNACIRSLIDKAGRQTTNDNP